MNITVSTILQEPDRAQLRDRLSGLIVRVRQKRYPLSAQDAEDLFQAMTAETRRSEFDPAIYDRLWELLRHCPPHDKTRKVADMLLQNSSMSNRSDAIDFVLRAYSGEQSAYIKQYDQDPDPYVQDAIANAEFADNPKAALKRWERLLETGNVTHELVEVLPYSIAYCYELAELPQALQRYTLLDQQAGGNSLWSYIIPVIKQRLQQSRQ